MKTCTKCRMELDESQFYAAPNKKDGLQSWCAHCQTVANIDRANKKRGRISAAIGTNTELGFRVAGKQKSKAHRQAKIVKYGIDLVETLESLNTDPFA